MVSVNTQSMSDAKPRASFNVDGTLSAQALKARAAVTLLPALSDASDTTSMMENINERDTVDAEIEGSSEMVRAAAGWLISKERISPAPATVTDVGS